MSAERNIKQNDIYLTGNEITNKLSIKKNLIYKLYNDGRVRYIIKKGAFNQNFNLIHFNLDDFDLTIGKPSSN